MRLLVDLPQTQVRSLAGLTKTLRVSRAELIRRAVAEYVERHAASSAQVFGIWKDRKIDTLAYEDKLRDEWGK